MELGELGEKKLTVALGFRKRASLEVSEGGGKKRVHTEGLHHSLGLQREEPSAAFTRYANRVYHRLNLLRRYVYHHNCGTRGFADHS